MRKRFLPLSEQLSPAKQASLIAHEAKEAEAKIRAERIAAYAMLADLELPLELERNDTRRSEKPSD